MSKTINITGQFSMAVYNKRVNLLMTILGINVYLAAVIISEIDDISRFPTKERLLTNSSEQLSSEEEKLSRKYVNC